MPEAVELGPGLAVLAAGGPVEHSVVPPEPVHRVFVNVGRPYRLVETLGSTEHVTAGLPGDVAVVPAGLPFAVRSRDGTPQQVCSLVVAVAPEVLAAASEAGGVRGTAELVPVVGARSAAVGPLAGLLHDGLADLAAPGRLLLETLGAALVAALVRDHASARPKAVSSPAGLSRGQLARVVRHVEDHLADPLPVAELAALAGVSEFHFSRLFRAATGDSPHRYVVGRRLARARELLVGSDLPVAAVAARCGFADQSHLTRHARRAFGATPAAVRAAARAP